MTERHDLIAYLATLGTLLTVFIASLVMGAWYPDIIGKIEAFGLGTITGGLIGLLRIPSARTVTVDNKPSDPIPSEPAP